ncbi:hypothetical protein GF345_00840 [Candidatus Woesearchaeota archaeon]|nr:hypothetical protein [Candidatus Woesearchaeota archaeon]
MEYKKATPALVLGLISIPLAIIPLLGLPAAIGGISLSILRMENHKKNAMLGLILSIIGLVLGGLNAVFGVFFASTGQYGFINTQAILSSIL